MVDKQEELKPKRGGYRPGAGRPKEPETVTIRIPASMEDTVKLMVMASKMGHSVEYRIILKGSQGEN